MTSNEHDNPTTAGQQEEQANGAAQPDAGVGSDAYTEYATSGANPFSSAYSHGTGMFHRLSPREFPEDEAPDVPEMEQLPDPNALPDPGYPVMTGYEAFPSVASAFPPSAEPSSAEASSPEGSTAEGRSPEHGSPGYGSPDHGSADRGSAEPSLWPSASSWPTASSAAFTSGPYHQLPDSSYADSGAYPEAGADSPYQAPRAPEKAPPLRGPARPPSDMQPATRPEEAPPLTGTQPSSTTGAPSYYPDAPPLSPPGQPSAPTSYAAAMEPLSAPPALQEPVTEGQPARETAETLTTDILLHGKRAAPGVGWRRTVYRASGGLIKIGESAANLRRRDLINRVRTPVAGGHHRVAVMSLKGGVGKTTAAVGLGSTLASLRGDRVIAVDGNPDRGTLSDKVRLETSATIRDLLNERAQVSRYADVRAFTSQSSSRLEILASDRDPGVSVAFSADDYRAVARVLEHYYSICITDCGTGLLHSAMAGILELADQIVLVSSPSVDGARSASATLDWLEAHEYGDLVKNGVVVLSTIRPRSKSSVDLDRLEQHFASRCRAVVRIPYDSHLEEGAEVELEMLNSDTADAYLSLAAIVGDGFAVPRRPAYRITRTAPLA
jgi:MinD-like ATPase involved in chromosome partitioning or flagellar assembly